MIIKYFKALRIGEVSMLTGFVLVGALFSIRSLEVSVPWYELIMIFSIGFCSISSLYAFNAYQGRKHDALNERLESLSDISPRVYLIYFTVLFLLSLALGYYLHDQIVYLLLILGFFGIIYSIPGIGKDRPFAGTLIHLLFQMTAFQIAYVVFEPISLNSLLISIYFSLLYMAGHFHHQVIDYEADKVALINTGAVHMGIEKSEKISFLIFSTAMVYWYVLYYLQIITFSEFMPFSLAFAFHIVAFIMYREKFVEEPRQRLRYRTFYRVLYFLAGVMLIESLMNTLT